MFRHGLLKTIILGFIHHVSLLKPSIVSEIGSVSFFRGGGYERKPTVLVP
jgi:hypothetical protein